LTVRPAQPHDREAFLRLIVEKKSYSPYPVRGLSSDSQKMAHISSYRAHWELDWQVNRFQVLLAENGGRLRGYVVLRGDLLDGVTQQPQTCIFDHWGSSRAVSQALLEATEGVARDFATEHLVIEIAPDQVKDRELVVSLGFQAEIDRVARRAEAWRPPADSPWRCRPARQSDSLFVTHLNAISLPVVVPPGRSKDMDEVSMDFMAHYSSLRLEDDPELLVLILEQGRRQAGYLILQRGIPDASVAYVYDIAIEPRHQGKGAAQFLVNCGSHAAFEEGFSALTGDISATNSRALRTAVQGLGFEIERHRYGRPLQVNRL
jgi:GNAT superfamily N-acetyltransferase